MRVCVYTAIFGGYDRLVRPAAQSVPTDFVCFTDAAIPGRHPLWRVVRDPRLPDLHPRMRAKWFKTHPHVLFPDGRPLRRGFFGSVLRRDAPAYDYTIWIDGNIVPKSQHFVRDMIASVGATGLALFSHPDRDCIYAEAAESVRWAKYRDLPILAQVESYRREGYPEHNGLMAGGIIVRHRATSELAAIDEAWWQENLCWTYQDQLSLPVVLWRQGRTSDRINGHLWFNDWYDRPPHLLEEGPI